MTRIPRTRYRDPHSKRRHIAVKSAAARRRYCVQNNNLLESGQLIFKTENNKCTSNTGKPQSSSYTMPRRPKTRLDAPQVDLITRAQRVATGTGRRYESTGSSPLTYIISVGQCSSPTRCPCPYCTLYSPRHTVHWAKGHRRVLGLRSIRCTPLAVACLRTTHAEPL